VRDRCIITIAVLIAFRFGNELKTHMRFALNLGISLDEVLEIVMQSANYTCWGAGLEASRAAMEVFTSEQKETHPKYSSSELRERGKNIIRQLRGQDCKDDLLRAIGEVCPDFLKVITTEHLFGEVWSRPGLELRDRCMIALAILVARRFGDELKEHMRYALNIGLSREEILEVILHTANYTCWGAGVEATKAGKEVLIA
jgi:4-carboxymuconolactone decarboxylase